MTTYTDNTWPEWGVTHQWINATVKDRIRTSRGTLIEMIERPNWGIACYMNNEIQSCDVDEQLYHESLVHPAMASVQQPKRVMIIGGGEGATLREVLKWPTVEHVDMYEWDKEVVTLFQTKYPQWANGAWNNPKVTIHYQDIFQAIRCYPFYRYDVIIIDLFDPSDDNKIMWESLFYHLEHWKNDAGTIVLYAGIRSFTQSIQPYEFLEELIEHSSVQLKEVIPYHVYIPSFLSESVFILITSHTKEISFDSIKTNTHLTPDIWKSYTIFNW
jgi:spermidine synthase